MRLRLALLPLVLAACSHKPPATDWTPAHWGMMPSEVLNGVPNTTPESGDRLVTGATARVRLEAAAVAGATLPAEFYFLDDRLVQVMFSDSQYHDNADSRKTLGHLSAQLRKQYGAETLGKAMDPALGLSYSASLGRRRHGGHPVGQPGDGHDVDGHGDLPPQGQRARLT